MAVDILTDLPPELCANILETLDVCSACKACCVNSKWLSVIVSCNPLWRKLCYKHCSKKDIEKDFNAGYSWKVSSQAYIKRDCTSIQVLTVPIVYTNSFDVCLCIICMSI